MIQNVSFKGREECLTAPLKKLKQPAEEFIAESTLIKDSAAKITNTVENLAKEEAAKLNEAYKAAHAPFLTKKLPTEAEKFGEDYRAAHGMPLK